MKEFILEAVEQNNTVIKLSELFKGRFRKTP